MLDVFISSVESYVHLGILTVILLIAFHISRDQQQNDHNRNGNGTRKRFSKGKFKKGRKIKTKAAKSKIDIKENDIQPCKNENPPVLIAMDCEMVGIGRRGSISMLARCSLVTLQQDHNGNERIVCIYDKYVKPTRTITDYRTQWSGITADHLQGDKAIPFEVCQSQVRNILKCTEERKILLIGHALENDFEVLQLWHPKKYIRDTAFYKPFMRPVRKKLYSQKLSHLAQEHLDVVIQRDKCHSPSIHVHIDLQNENISTSEHHLGHSSIEDASAALLLYKKFEKEWEESLSLKYGRLPS